MTTLRDLLAAFLDHERDRNFSRCTLRNHRYLLTAFLDWLETQEHATTADQLRKAHLDAWLKHLNGHRTPKGLPFKAQSLNLHIIAARMPLE